MGKPPYSVLFGVAAIVAAGAVRHLVAADDSAPRPIVVVVDDRADVHPAVLDRATKEAGRIYLQAGVKTIWSKAATRSSESTAVQDLSTHGFAVNLVILARFRGARGDSTFLMGATPPTSLKCGGTAYVFQDQVRGFSNIRQVESARVLGIVVAHEIGHLVTRQRGHSADGLMRARWDSGDWERASFGLLLFSLSDSSTVRETLQSCR